MALNWMSTGGWTKENGFHMEAVFFSDGWPDYM
jgi:hypothetical protein